RADSAASAACIASANPESPSRSASLWLARSMNPGETGIPASMRIRGDHRGGNGRLKWGFFAPEAARSPADPATGRGGIPRTRDQLHAERPAAMLGRDEQIAGEHVGEVIACGRVGFHPARSGTGRRALDTSIELGI